MFKKVLKLFFLFLIAFLVYLFYPHKVQRIFYFPDKNDSSFASFLLIQDIGLNRFDIYFLKFLDIQKGWIRIESNSLNKIDIINLAKAKKSEKTRIMIAYGGESVDEFLKKIASQANLNRAKLKEIFLKKAKFGEASILARKYYIPYKIDEASVLNYILAKTLQEYQKIAKKHKLKVDSKEFYKKLIIASIIQKETNWAKEMPLVASVIYNRLKKDLKLQMDATLNYGKNVHTIITPKMIKEDSSAFNTYKHKGLPPVPLAMFSLNALRAIFSPADTNYLYFVQGKKGHKFSSNYQKHKRRVIAYKKSIALKYLLQKEFKRVSQTIASELKPTLFRLYLPIKIK